jgi:hypothetical protein
MKSVLISVDFVYRQDGTLHPTELNTSTKDELSIGVELTKNNFIENVSDYFDHELLNSFMVKNNLTKIITISAGGDDRLYKSFAEYYDYQFERISVGFGQLTVPEIEDSDDTLIIRIAYDTYALIDDLYARDNYEFHNLISGESFASPVTFIENNFDTITEFESSQDGVIPNYVVKARTPGYIETFYPRGYRFDSNEELNSLKQNLGYDEFIQKFEYNDSLSLIDGRTHHLRTMSLICGGTLEVLNLVHYKSINSVSTLNERLVYENEIDSNKRLNDLFLSKYYPNWLSKSGLNFHSSATDFILRPNDTLIPFSDLRIDDELKYIFYTQELSDFEEQDFSIFKNPELGTTNVIALTKTRGGILVNITATHEEYGTFTWDDGVGNSYVVRKSSQTNDEVMYFKAGKIEIGDSVMVFNKKLNSVIPLKVESITFSYKDIDLYLISLTPKSEFLVQLDENNTDLYLIQHNACDNRPGRCFFSVASCPNGTVCSDCGKNSPNCVNCGGSATPTCQPPL